jgi:5-hydroxyisourate hydrolase
MTLSTHILDTALGRPAPNVDVTLSQFDGESWQAIGLSPTDADGRCKTLLSSHPLLAATYKLRFHTAPYFQSLNLPTHYPKK